MMIGKIDTS